MISTNNLNYKYSNSKSLRFPDFTCNPDEILLILGSSGIGKSTLLHLLSGILKLQTGNVNIQGTAIETLDDRELDRFRGKHIGIIFQQNHFIDSLSVIENVIIAQSLIGNKVDKTAAKSLLERLGIGHKENVNINEISQGEKQRVAIARALINSPKLILADEPTSALDDTNCQEVLTLLEEQAKSSNAALIIVTHDTRLKEKIANRVILENA